LLFSDGALEFAQIVFSSETLMPQTQTQSVVGDTGLADGEFHRTTPAVANDTGRASQTGNWWDPQFFLNGDDRGGAGTNSKPSLTITDAAAQLTRTGLSWATGLGQAATVTYAFRSTAPATMPTDTADFTRFTELQIAATLLALQSWSDVANITFTRVQDVDGYSNSAVMLFGNYGSGQTGSAAFAYNPGSRSVTSAAGDVWIGAGVSSNTSPGLLNYGQQTLVHEIGHAIGLSHPAAYNAAEGVSITYGADAVYYEDSRQYTVMSYFSQTNTGGVFGNIYSSAPLLDDIAAAQRLYGANMTTRTGDTVYGFNSNANQAWFVASSATTALIFAVWDAGGTDTLDFSGYTQNQTIDLRQGSFSSVGGLTGNVAIALGAVIERAIGGSGADLIYGNAGDNLITGGAGNDTIRAGLGIDTAVFSGARSAYTITYSGQTTTVTGPDGTDTLYDVEFLRFSDQTVTVAAPSGALTLDGDITNNTITGGALGDTLNGLGGDDILNGLGGSDQLHGGSGNDSLYGGEGNDFLEGGLGNDLLDGGAGIDLAYYAAATGGVNVDLAGGVATGAAGNDTLVGIENVYGTTFADVLRGDAGNNQLLGNGGVDTLYGGDGDDALTAGAPGLSGGAPDIVKLQTAGNYMMARAVSLDASFDLLSSNEIANSTTIPHATVRATSGHDLEFYAFTVTAGARVTFDIDNASFDSTLRLYSGDGTQLAENDDGGSDSADTDSLLTYTFATAGVYYIQVGQWSTNTETSFTTTAMGAGSTYSLHVSIPDHGVQPLVAMGSTLYGENGNDTLNGGGGNDTLYGGDGNDTITGYGGTDTIDGSAGDDLIYILTGGAGSIEGGAGSDTVRINAMRADATVTTVNGVTTLSSQMGAYSLTGVEFIRFVDQTVTLGAAGGGTDGPDTLLGTTGADTINGLGGDDVITPGLGSDTIDGGAGIDTLVLPGTALNYYFERSGSGWRVYDGANDVDTVVNVEQVRFANGASVSFETAAAGGFDALRYVASNPDMIPYFASRPAAAYQHYVAHGAAEGRPTTSFDGLIYEASNFDLARALGVDAAAATRHYVEHGFQEGRAANSFNPLTYEASNIDLARSLGVNPTAATLHYIQYGNYEGRPTATFNALNYLASNVDLARSLGINTTAATIHYIEHGNYEGRPTNTFNPLIYLASNVDLARALGTDTTAAAQHYIQYGNYEGRPTNTFNGLTYLASNVDLARSLGADAVSATFHYIQYGNYEGRPTATFDALVYLASNVDLARSLGVDATAATIHYIEHGNYEGRATATFDPRLYAASSTDLAQYIGTDRQLALEHYILHGNFEGRPTSGFDSVAYLLSNSDLAGLTPDAALTQWLSVGADQGRAGDAAFGREQLTHALTGGSASGVIDIAGDHDWFQVTLGAGQAVTFNIAAQGAGAGTLSNSQVTIYDATGHVIISDADSGPGLDARATFTPTTAGLYYVVVTGAPGTTGSYVVNLTTGSSAPIETTADKDGQALRSPTVTHETVAALTSPVEAAHDMAPTGTPQPVLADDDFLLGHQDSAAHIPLSVWSFEDATNWHGQAGGYTHTPMLTLSETTTDDASAAVDDLYHLHHPVAPQDFHPLLG
jgi:Ca2+-binding RTX toxin-like protein